VIITRISLTRELDITSEKPGICVNGGIQPSSRQGKNPKGVNGIHENGDHAKPKVARPNSTSDMVIKTLSHSQSKFNDIEEYFEIESLANMLYNAMRPNNIDSNANVRQADLK